MESSRLHGTFLCLDLDTMSRVGHDVGMAHTEPNGRGTAMSKLRTVRDLPSEMVEYFKDVERSGTDYGKARWWDRDDAVVTELPEVGGQWSYGDWSSATADDATHVLLRHTTYGDYHGDAVEVSNYRTIKAAYPDAFTEVYGDYGTSALMLALDYMPADDPERDDTPAERLDYMIEDLSSLADYPLYDEEDHTYLEMEWADEAIESYLRADMSNELSRAGREAESDILAAEPIDNVRKIVWRYYSDAGQYPYSEAVETIVFPGSHNRDRDVSELTEYVILAILAEWAAMIEGEMTVNGQDPLV